MNHDLDKDALRVLARARQAWSPTEQQADRVRSAAWNALLSAAPDTEGWSGEQAAPAGPRRGSAKLLAAGACIVVLSGMLGYLWLWPVSRQPASSPRVSSSVSAAPTAFKAATGDATPPWQAEQLVANPASRTPLADALSSVPPVNKHDKRQRSEAPVAPRSQTVASLAAEVRALRRAEHALRQGQPQSALAILEELDRSVPDGKLGQERFTAFVVARCAFDPAARASLLQQFTGRYPRSMYLVRVEQSCAGERESNALKAR